MCWLSQILIEIQDISIWHKMGMLYVYVYMIFISNHSIPSTVGTKRSVVCLNQPLEEKFSFVLQPSTILQLLGIVSMIT